MHDHNNNGNKNGGHKGMMWMMVPCLLLFGVLFFGGGKFASSRYFWLIIVGVCVVPHLWMMFKGGHGGHSDDNTENKIDDTQMKNENDKSKHGGNCH